MLYRLCNNGRAILLDRQFKIIEDKLRIEIDETNDLYTAVIKIGNKIYYRTIKDGVTDLDKSFITPGVITISIIKNDEIKPTWVGDELYADVKGQAVVIGANTLQYDILLNELRVENDVYRERMTELENKINELTRHYEEIYAGYEIL